MCCWEVGLGYYLYVRRVVPNATRYQQAATNSVHMGYIRVDTNVSRPIPQHNVLHALCCFACCMPLRELLCWQVLYAYSHKLTQCRLLSTMWQINTKQWVAALYLQLFINLNRKGCENGFERGI